MTQHPTIQAQSVIYNNDIPSLLRAIDNMANAVRVEREQCGYIGRVSLRYGDASEKPILTQEQVEAIQKKFEKEIDFNYQVFGFNSGSAKGQNLLGLGTNADYILIMNPDIIVSPRFFIEMIYPFENTAVGLVEARQTPIEHHKQYDPTSMLTDWSTGACSLVPTKVFEAIDGYDSDTFFMYCDDVDFSWRVRLLGYQLYYQPLAPVYHAKRLSHNAAWKPTAAEEYYSAEAAILMAHKWSNPERVKKLLRIYSESANKNLNKAVEHYRQMEREGKLPTPIDPEHKVARFVGDYYAENRFTL
jgi:GT2 family glycosyltransferase